MNIIPKLMTLVALTTLCYCSSCGGDTPANDQQQTTDEVDLSAIDFKYTDNILRVRLPAEPDRLNPFLTLNTYARPIHQDIFIPLLEYNPVTMESSPAIAKGLPTVQEITEGPYAGGVRYTYELNENATFSDGQPVTVSDVVFSLKVLFNYNIPEVAPFRGSYDKVVDVETEGDHRITFVSSDKYILAEASYSSLNIFPEHVFDPNQLLSNYSISDLLNSGESMAADQPLVDFAEMFRSAPYSRDGSKLIGAGPYQLTEWVDGQHISMREVENWWGDTSNSPDRPDSLVFKIINDQTTAVNALRDQELDLAISIDPNSYRELEGEAFMTEHYAFKTTPTYSFFYLALNNEDPMLQDKRVRRALAHAIDVQTIIDNVYAGMATPVVGPISPMKAHYNESLKRIEKDLDRARELLDEAGWKDSNGNGIRDKNIDGEVVDMEITYYVTPGSKFAESLANLTKDGAEQIGIDITLETIDMRPLILDKVSKRDYQMFGLGAGGNQLLDDLMQLWHTSSNTPGGSNRWQFGNAETDALIEEINRTMDEGKRTQLYHQIQEVIYDEQPIVFLFAPQERVIINKRFAGDASRLLPNYHVRYFDYRLK